jgi:hypothetical protein
MIYGESEVAKLSWDGAILARKFLSLVFFFEDRHKNKT